MKRIYITIFYLLLFNIALVAQDEVKRLSLQECVKIALENNLRVKRSIYNVESFQINLLQYKAAFLPTVQATGSYNKNYGRNLNPVNYTYFQGVTTSINPSLNASWTLFNGFRITNTYKQGLKDSEAADQDLVKAKNDVILSVVSNYTNVVLNRELYENAQFQLNSSQEQLQRITKQVAAGALPLSNQLTQDAQVATNEVNLINQENALTLSLLQLKQAMQVPASTAIEPVIPDLNVEDLILSQTPEQIYQISLSTMPEIKSAMLKVQSAELALKASRGNLYPRISLSAGASSNYSSASDKARSLPDGTYSIDTSKPVAVVGGSNDPVYGYVPNTTLVSEKYGTSDQLNDNLYKQLGVSITVPIFNGFQSRTNVQRANITKQIADITVLETQNTLRQSIESAYNDASAASKTYNSSLRSVKAQEEAYRMNKQRFELGALSFVEYHVSENDLFRAKSDKTRAKYNFIFRKKLLDFYQGKQIEL